MQTLPTPLPQLLRIRWAVRAVLILGVAASIAGNVLHAEGGIIAQVIAAWSPTALLLTVELISRVPVHRRSLAAARLAATALIAGIAAWVSYWHMVGVAARYGETGASPYLLPLSVDGLIVVASICLVELGGRIAATSEAVAEPLAADDEPKPVTPEPVTEPAEPEPVRQRVTPPSLTYAARVVQAHDREPGAKHERIAELAGVSLATVKRHRPARVTGSPSDPDAAETTVNGRQPALV